MFHSPKVMSLALRGKSKEHIIAKAKAVYEKQVGRDASLSGLKILPASH
jgi:hypothetical protein